MICMPKNNEISFFVYEIFLYIYLWDHENTKKNLENLIIYISTMKEGGSCTTKQTSAQEKMSSSAKWKFSCVIYN